jgi:ElaB/YqjD/DUF883 family membrane-anchored ribosome-binding protein
MNTTSIDSSRQKLAGDFRNVVTDVEELLKATAGQTSGQVLSARDRVAESMKQMRIELENAEHAAIAKAKQAAAEVNHYAHENPWQAVGIAAGIGFLLGVVVTRR